MIVSDIFNSLKQKQDVYIIGTGPSLRLFPVEILKDKITIGLNQAYKNVNCIYNLTIHPELIDKGLIKEQFWIAKRKDWLATPEANKFNDRIYWFWNNRDVKCFDYIKLDGIPGAWQPTLYVGRGIHTAALSLAAKMGARTAFLVGVDLAPIDDQHHSTGQSVRFNGLPPDGVYDEYFANALIVRSKVKELYGMNVVSMTPFLGLKNYVYDYQYQLEELKLQKFPTPVDDSYYKRDKLDFIL